MSLGQWISLGIGAVLVFWMVGAYNRLVALRSAIGTVLQQVDELVQRRAGAALALCAVVAEPMAAERPALDAWSSAHREAQQACVALRARPVMAALAATLAAAESAVAAAGSRVLALLEQAGPVSAEPGVAAHLATLREAESRLVFARQLFNHAAQAYNDAARQFPTRLLVRLYGFGTAGRL